MTKSLILLATAAALAGCQTASAPLPRPVETAGIDDATAFDKARQAVIASLKDPDSAKFVPTFTRRTVKSTSMLDFGQPRDVVCGFVNAKNGFGGYSGKQQFVYMVRTGDVFVDGPSNRLEDAIATSWCQSLFGTNHQGI